MQFTEISSGQKQKPQFIIAGFLPFVDGAEAIGYLRKAIFKDDKRGFFIVELTEPCTVNIDQSREENAQFKTGQRTANAGECVGIRATKALACLRAEDVKDHIVKVLFCGTEKRTGRDGNAYEYHNLRVWVAAQGAE